jgi:hypothetical protein
MCQRPIWWFRNARGRLPPSRSRYTRHSRINIDVFEAKPVTKAVTIRNASRHGAVVSGQLDSVPLHDTGSGHAPQTTAPLLKRGPTGTCGASVRNRVERSSARWGCGKPPLHRMVRRQFGNPAPQAELTTAAWDGPPAP